MRNRRDLTGETVLGMRVAAWRWPIEKPADVSQEKWDSTFPHGAGHRYAEHWSTGPAHAERLFTETAVRERGLGRRLRRACGQLLSDLGHLGKFIAAFGLILLLIFAV